MTDTGGGNQILQRLYDSETRIGDIRNLYISHIHTDHILGAIWIIRLILSERFESGDWLNVLGSEVVLTTLTKLCNMLIQQKYLERMPERIQFDIIHPGDKRIILGKKVCFFDIAAQTTLQYGYIMEYAENRRFVFCGDEPFRRKGSGILENADWAVLEATDPYAKHPQMGHASLEESARTAEEASVRNLVLTHTDDSEGPERKRLYEKIASTYYNGNVFVPDDMDSFQLD